MGKKTDPWVCVSLMGEKKTFLGLPQGREERVGKKTLFSVPDIVSFLSESSNSLPDSEKGYIATLVGRDS